MLGALCYIAMLQLRMLGMTGDIREHEQHAHLASVPGSGRRQTSNSNTHSASIQLSCTAYEASVHRCAQCLPPLKSPLLRMLVCAADQCPAPAALPCCCCADQQAAAQRAQGADPHHPAGWCHVPTVVEGGLPDSQCFAVSSMAGCPCAHMWCAALGLGHVRHEGLQLVHKQ